MQPLMGAIAALVGTTVVVLIIWWLTTRGARTASSRLRELVPEEEVMRYGQTAGREDMLPTVTRVLSARRMTESLYVELAAAGLPLRPSEFVGVLTGCVILSQVIAILLTRNILLYIVFAILALLIPFGVLRVLQARRRAQFDAQIVDALVLIASSLRSGFSFMRALQMVAQEMGPPISVEFERIVNEVNVGRSMEDALRAAVARVGSYDFDLVVTAVLVQLQVGGNLADILETIAGTIRERVRIMGEVRTLTAEGKLSGISLILVPIALAVVLTFFNPQYMSTLINEQVGHYLLAIAALLQLIGGYIIKRMLAIDF